MNQKIVLMTVFSACLYCVFGAAGLMAQITVDGEPADSSIQEAPSTTPSAASSNVYTCTLQGLVRRVEIVYDNPPANLPCSVNYYKDSEAPGEVSTLWHAANDAGYCESKTQNFIQKLTSWGWSCAAN